MKLFYSDKYLIEKHNGEIIYYLFFNLAKHFLKVNSWYKQIKINVTMYENIIYSRKILPDLFKTFIGRCYWMKMFVSMIDVKFSLKTVVFAVVDICCRCLNFIAAVSKRLSTHTEFEFISFTNYRKDFMRILYMLERPTSYSLSKCRYYFVMNIRE